MSVIKNKKLFGNSTTSSGWTYSASGIAGEEGIHDGGGFQQIVCKNASCGKGTFYVRTETTSGRCPYCHHKWKQS